MVSISKSVYIVVQVLVLLEFLKLSDSDVNTSTVVQTLGFRHGIDR